MSKKTKIEIIKVTRSNFATYINDKTGLCTKCNEFVRGMRPDGSGGLCPHCFEKSSVVGIQTAVDQSLIVITKDKKIEKTAEEKKAKAQRINAGIDKRKNKTEAEVDGVPSEKKKWARADFAKYYKTSDELSDFTCSKSGVIKKRFKKPGGKK